MQNSAEDEVSHLESPCLHLRVEVPSSASLVHRDPKLRVTSFFLEKIKFSLLQDHILLQVEVVSS